MISSFKLRLQTFFKVSLGRIRVQFVASENDLVKKKGLLSLPTC